MKNLKEFVEGLHLLTGFSFPLKCSRCGKVYESPEDFIEKTFETDNLEGVFECYDNNQQRILEILRECTCGTLLIEKYENRRDFSSEGKNIRLEFSKLEKALRLTGMNQEKAHELLLSIYKEHGGESLENLEV